MTKSFLAVILLLAAFAPAQQAPVIDGQQQAGEAPRLVRFTGDARLSGPTTVNVVFSLYAASGDSTPLWQESQNVSVDATGHFAALLGGATPGGLPHSIFASTEARWLGIRIGNVEQPRVLLVSVPYALKAGDADSLGGHSAAEFVTQSQLNALARKFTPSTAVAIAPQSAITPVPLATSGTAGFLGKFTNTTDLGNSLFFDTGNSIGFGTTTPGMANLGLRTFTLFHPTTAAMELASGRTSSGQGSVFYWIASGSSSTDKRVAFMDVFIDTTKPSYGAKLRFGTRIAGQPLTTSMVLDQWGKLGLGTTLPTQQLDVVGNIKSSASVMAATFVGSGASLTNLPAAELTGTLPSARFSGTYSNALTLSNPANAFIGNGAGLTALNATNLATGTVPSAVISGVYSNPVSFTSPTSTFTGDGTGLVINANNLVTGAVPAAAISGTYDQTVNFSAPGSIISNANNSAQLGGIAALSFARKDLTQVFTGTNNFASTVNILATLDATTAAFRTSPVRMVTSQPGTCTSGELAINTSNAAGQQLLLCSASAWTQVNAADSTKANLSGGNTLTGDQNLDSGNLAVRTQGNGIILKATDGANCFLVTVNNAGTLSTASATCP